MNKQRGRSTPAVVETLEGRALLATTTGLQAVYFNETNFAGATYEQAVAQGYLIVQDGTDGLGHNGVNVYIDATGAADGMAAHGVVFLDNVTAASLSSANFIV